MANVFLSGRSRGMYRHARRQINFPAQKASQPNSGCNGGKPPKKGSAGRRRAAPDFRFTTPHYNSALRPSDPSDGRIRPLKGPLKRPFKGPLLAAHQLSVDVDIRVRLYGRRSCARSFHRSLAHFSHRSLAHSFVVTNFQR